MNLSLNQKLAQIGVRLSLRDEAKRKSKALVFDADIEDTLLEAAAQIPKESKLFSLLLSWIEVHAEYVIVEKLMKKTQKLDLSDPARVWINALAIYATHRGFHKWKRWVEKAQGDVYLYPKKTSQSALKLKGAVSYFEEKGYLIPEGSIRVRAADALTPIELSRQNKQYQNRLLYGPSWRADIITAIEEGIETPYAIAALVGCSYEPAHRVFNEYNIAKGIAA